MKVFWWEALVNRVLTPFGWELCVNGGAAEAEKSGLSWIFSVDPGYLENMGGRFRVVLFGWGFEVYGPS